MLALFVAVIALITEGADTVSATTGGSAWDKIKRSELILTELGPQIAEAPRAAVIEAWFAVERELEALAEESGIADFSDLRA